VGGARSSSSAAAVVPLTGLSRGPDADNGRWNVVKPETHVHVIEG